MKRKEETVVLSFRKPVSYVEHFDKLAEEVHLDRTEFFDLLVSTYSNKSVTPAQPQEIIHTRSLEPLPSILPQPNPYEIKAQQEIEANAAHSKSVMDDVMQEEENEKHDEAFSTVSPTDLMNVYRDQIDKEYK